MAFQRGFLTLLALAASMFITVSAYAIPVAPNTLTTFAFGNTYEIDMVDIGVSGVTFTDTYNFTANSTRMIVDDVSFSTNKFSSLQFSLFDGTTTILLASFTNSIGSIVQSVVDLVYGQTYDLIVTGLAIGTGTNRVYGADLIASSVPLPPAILLLLSGLFGVGFMGRRKLGSPKVSL